MKKLCCICKKLIDISCFKKNKSRKDGLQTQCIECQKEYRRKHYIENRQKYIDKAALWRKEFVVWWKEYKKQFSCQRCDENHISCIDFHHTSNNKEECVAKLVSMGNKEKLLQEIAKCIPLCSNCHRKEHWKN